MACNVSEILHNHLQLCQWQDELEFLCFVLCNIIEPPKDPNVTYQTFDLLTFLGRIDKACEDPHGRLRELLQEPALSDFKCYVDKTKQIRNLVAHHVPVRTILMEKKEVVAESAIAALDQVIRRGAKRYQVDQVKINWYPIAHTPAAIPAIEDFFKVAIVISKVPVLSSRQTYLQNGAFCQEYLSMEHRCWLNEQRQHSSKSDDRKPVGSPKKSKKSKKKKRKKRKGLSKHPHSTPKRTSASQSQEGGVRIEDSGLEEYTQPDIDNSLIPPFENLHLS